MQFQILKSFCSSLLPVKGFLTQISHKRLFNATINVARIERTSKHMLHTLRTPKNDNFAKKEKHIKQKKTTYPYINPKNINCKPAGTNKNLNRDFTRCSKFGHKFPTLPIHNGQKTSHCHVSLVISSCAIILHMHPHALH